MIVTDVKVGDATLYNVEITTLDNGNIQYRTPDVIMAVSPKVQQVSIEGIGPALDPKDVRKAVEEHYQNLLDEGIVV